jgi:hypothetical protein
MDQVQKLSNPDSSSLLVKKQAVPALNYAMKTYGGIDVQIHVFFYLGTD